MRESQTAHIERVNRIRVQSISDAEVETLAKILRSAYVMTQIGRSATSFKMTQWDDLVGREKAPYLAQSIAAFRHFNGLPLLGEQA